MDEPLNERKKLRNLDLSTEQSSQVDEKLEKIKLLKKKIELQEGLPFLYGWKWYDWAWDFFESQNKINLLCAANQISKSSTQIRKCIEWATNKKKWPALWKHKPVQFWYLYPTSDVAKIEFVTKWKQFLPAGKYKDDPIYGWKEEWQQRKLFAIHFNSGVHVYFKTYSQNSQHLQTGSCDALFCDEELPTDLYDELIFRISASEGYFHMVFTATLGQEFWRKAMEPGPREQPTLPGAWKRTVSAYECLRYMDGSPTHWSEDKINVIKNRCKSKNEILKRVYGRFVMDAGLKYPAFDIKRHMKKWHPIPKTWLVHEGVDIGSGGAKGHPAAILFVAVSPDYRQGRVFCGWRGDGIETTSSDILTKHFELKKKNHIITVAQKYDWAARDFFTVASRVGEPFAKAEKSHEIGEDIINTLFKNDMMAIYDTEELQKLAGELTTVRVDQDKRKAKDDFIDAFRYAVADIAWDWTVITGEKPFSLEKEQKLTGSQFRAKERRDQWIQQQEQEKANQDVQDEINEWNALYEVGFG